MSLPSVRKEWTNILDGVSATRDRALLCSSKAIRGFKVDVDRVYRGTSMIGVLE